MGFYTRNKTAIWFTVAVLFLAADRFLKALAQAGFMEKPLYLVENIFSLKAAQNHYIAFSLPWSAGFFLNSLTLLIIVGLTYYLVYLYKKQKPKEKMGLVFFLLLGATSNLVDRLEWGYVLDYFDLKYFTVFNLADVMIVLGAGGLIWWNIKKGST